MRRLAGEPFPLLAIRKLVGNSANALAGLEGLSSSWRLGLTLLVALALITRCPEMFTRAQFYAEDGYSWYAQAYNGGWLHSLRLTQGGYFCLLQRLGAGLSMLVPFRFAPLVMAVIGLAVQCLPVLVLLGPRCRSWGPLPLRLLYALIYVSVPNAQEVHVVLTNAQWNLAVTLILLAFACPPTTRIARIGDCALFVIASVTGPFGALLLPFMLLYWWLRRQRRSLLLAAILGFGAVIQTIQVMHSASRTTGPLGARFSFLLRIIGTDIIGGAMLGRHFERSPGETHMIWIVPAVGLGLCIYGYCLKRAHLQLRLFTLYCLILLAFSLRSPIVVSAMPHWRVLILTPQSRYWYFPMLAFLWGAAWCAMRAPTRLFSVAGGCVICLLPIGIAEGWRYQPYIDEHFSVFADRLEAAPAGTLVIIPITPEGRRMELIKRKS